LFKNRQDLPQAALPVLFLLTTGFWGFHVAPTKVKFGREEQTVGPLLPAKFHLSPKTEKNSNFTNIIALMGGSLARFFYKIYRVLSLHNCVKFGCFISINDKIINNFL